MKLLLIVLSLVCSAASAQNTRDELAERDRRIAELERQVAHLYEHHSHEDEAEGKAEDEHVEHDEDGFRLLDLSLNIMTSAGTSSSTNRELEGLQLGNHDPRRRGFTLQQAEFAFSAALAPYFAGEAYLVATDEIVELEEAFLRSIFSPWFEVKAGYFLTEFGRINNQHPHEWRFMDQPVVNGRLLGAEGMRGIGGQVAVQLHAPWSSRWLFSVQNSDDPSMSSFLGEGHSHDDEEHAEETVGGYPRVERRTRNIGDLVYSFRWENVIQWGEHVQVEPGVSFATGPNATGETGRTWLVGGDLSVGWRSNDAFARVQGEFIYRYFQANGAELEGGESLEASVLGDWGWYVELTGSPIRDFHFGLRIDQASGFRSGEEIRQQDPRRDDRWRLSPLIAYQPIDEFVVSLQYNFDHTQHLGGDTSHSVWVGIRILFGAHKHIH